MDMRAWVAGREQLGSKTAKFNGSDYCELFSPGCGR
jgi:hypothetical protein